MQTPLHPPSSPSVVYVTDSLVERYVAAGWTRAETKTRKAESSGSDEKPRPVKRSPRRSSK